MKHIIIAQYKRKDNYFRIFSNSIVVIFSCIFLVTLECHPDNTINIIFRFNKASSDNRWILLGNLGNTSINGRVSTFSRIKSFPLLILQSYITLLWFLDSMATFSFTKKIIIHNKRSKLYKFIYWLKLWLNSWRFESASPIRKIVILTTIILTNSRRKTKCYGLKWVPSNCNMSNRRQSRSFIV